MHRHWLLTWTTHGTWLPGDRRGSVGKFRDRDGQIKPHNRPGESFALASEALATFAKDQMTSKPVFLNREHAELIVAQFQETARFRDWRLLAAAVMSCHIHLIAAVADDPSPSSVLRDFKSYCSRKLNSQMSESIKWWTKSGSTRKLPTEQAVMAAVKYVQSQSNPLLIWIDDGYSHDQSIA